MSATIIDSRFNFPDDVLTTINTFLGHDDEAFASVFRPFDSYKAGVDQLIRDKLEFQDPFVQAWWGPMPTPSVRLMLAFWFHVITEGERGYYIIPDMYEFRDKITSLMLAYKRACLYYVDIYNRIGHEIVGMQLHGGGVPDLETFAEMRFEYQTQYIGLIMARLARQTVLFNTPLLEPIGAFTWKLHVNDNLITLLYKIPNSMLNPDMSDNEGSLIVDWGSRVAESRSYNANLWNPFETPIITIDVDYDYDMTGFIAPVVMFPLEVSDEEYDSDISSI